MQDISQFLSRFGLLEREGIYPDMSHEDYHADRSAVNGSKLKLMLKSPRLYLRAPACSANTPSTSLGSAIHAALLESDRFSAQYIVKPTFNRRTKAGKADEAAFVRDHPGSFFISAKDAWIIKNVRESVLQHQGARRLLTRGVAERAMFWRDERTGLMCKTKPDLERDGIIVDIKSTTDASKQEFRHSIARLHYDLTAFMQQLGVKRITGETKQVVYIAVETEEPFNTAVYIASDAQLASGQAKFEFATDRLKYCLSTGDWFGYQPQGIPEEIDVAGWGLLQSQPVGTIARI
ncbi:PD-(D/E)XK nuclease-like domain-containing protein [Duganella vulcania]|uniref:Putative exodeoxyribonuclease 8 PDDEXK-like domain-containing protein n=1 Tax=Duganella vulcania TaxID=2692166 RepID=A0A845GHL0_9BURK|nr:PD-(D/E)XK nuclease-like domain-containing protein [Duganella vulcania]MYM92796.1 hypothetical protein [Duganella vulcania]